MVFILKNITNKQLAEQALNKVKETANELRRRGMQKRLDYYQGKQINYLTSALNSQFKFPDRMKLQKEFYNITQLIIDEIGVLYNEAPFREVIEGTEKDNDIYQMIVEDSHLDAVMDTVNKLTKLTKTVLVRPTWQVDKDDPRKGKIKFAIYTPNMFDVIQDEDDPTKAKAVIYSYTYYQTEGKYYGDNDTNISNDPFTNDDTIYYYWDKDNHFSFTYKLGSKKQVEIILRDNPGNEDNVNPYGIFPFAVFRDGQPVDQFFLETGEDLINTNESVNVKITELNYLIKMQAFSVPVRKGAEKGDALTFDPSMTIDLPGDDDVNKGADFKYVSPDAKIAEVQSEIDQKLMRLAVKYKLNSDIFTSSRQKSSAEALQLQSYYLGKAIKRDKPLFRAYEKDLFGILKVVFNKHSTQGQLSDSAELLIDFGDIEMPMTQAETDAHNLVLYNNGLMSKKDWLMSINPDIRTGEEADLYLEEIKQEKKDNMEEFMQSAAQIGGQVTKGPNPETTEANKGPSNVEPEENNDNEDNK